MSKVKSKKGAGRVKLSIEDKDKMQGLVVQRQRVNDAVSDLAITGRALQLQLKDIEAKMDSLAQVKVGLQREIDNFEETLRRVHKMEGELILFDPSDGTIRPGERHTQIPQIEKEETVESPEKEVSKNGNGKS